jgi:hypothetical protein
LNWPEQGVPKSLFLRASTGAENESFKAPPIPCWRCTENYTLWNVQDRNRSNEVWAVMVLRISEYTLDRTFNLDRKKAIPKEFHCSRVGGGALTRWPPSAAQTARAGFLHAAFAKTQPRRNAKEGIKSSNRTSSYSP